MFLGHTRHVESSFDKYEILFQIKWVSIACSLHNHQDVGFVWVDIFHLEDPDVHLETHLCTYLNKKRFKIWNARIISMWPGSMEVWLRRPPLSPQCLSWRKNLIGAIEIRWWKHENDVKIISIPEIINGWVSYSWKNWEKGKSLHCDQVRTGPTLEKKIFCIFGC